MLTTFICHQFVTWVMISLSNARSTCSSSSSSSITYTQNNLRVWVSCYCVCVRERERDDYVSMWISIPRDNNPKSSLLFSKRKIMHSDLLRPWNAYFFRTHNTARVRRRQCARAFFPSFYDRYFPVLYRYIRTVWVLSFTSLRSIPLLKAAGC
jgi:hypothetical protein